MVAELAGIAPLQLPVTPNGTDIPSAAAGMTVYVARANQSNANGNVDIFTFNNLAPGWTTDSAQLDSYDISHCPGTVTYRSPSPATSELDRGEQLTGELGVHDVLRLILDPHRFPPCTRTLTPI